MPDYCDSMNHSPQGSSVHGILQARILDWIAISFSILTYFIMIPFLLPLPEA